MECVHIFFLQWFHHDNVMMRLLFLCTDEMWSKHLSIDFETEKDTFLKEPKMMKKLHFWDNRKTRFLADTHRLTAIKSTESATLGVSCSSCVLSDSYGRREAGERAGGPDLTCKMLWNDVKTDPGEMNIFYRTFSCSYDRSELKIVLKNRFLFLFSIKWAPLAFCSR